MLSSTLSLLSTVTPYTAGYDEEVEECGVEVCNSL
nr:MAG TPA: hypothetical protein [Caudoviricetes sp.]